MSERIDVMPSTKQMLNDQVRIIINELAALEKEKTILTISIAKGTDIEIQFYNKCLVDNKRSVDMYLALLSEKILKYFDN